MRHHFGLLVSKSTISTEMLDKFLENFHSQRDVSSQVRYFRHESLVFVWTELPSVQHQQQVGVNFYHDEQVVIVGETNHLHFAEAYASRKSFAIALTIQDKFSEIADLYRDRGEAGFSLLCGDFALLIYDKAKRNLIGLRSAYGTPSIYFHRHAQGLLIASRTEPIIKAAKLKSECNPYKIVSTLCHMPPYQSHSFHAEIRQLPAGYKLTSTRSEEPSIERWMNLDPEHASTCGDRNERLSTCRKLLDQSISRTIPRGENFACEFSGGVDSTSIAAIALAMNTQEQLPWLYANTADRTLPMSEDDQRHFSDLERIRSHLPPHQMLAIPPKIYSPQQLEDFFQEWHEPPQRAYSLLAQIGLEHAREQGMTVILSGYGGDQLMTAHSHHLVYELIAKQQWSSLYSCLKRRQLKHPWRDWLRMYLRQQILRLPYGGALLSMKSKKLAVQHLLNSNFLKKEKIRELRLDQFIGDGLPQPPENLRQALYHLVEERGLVQEQCQYRNRIAGMHGLSYRFPLLDHDLITQALSLPSEDFYQDGQGRRLIKDLMSERLPIAKVIPKSYRSIPSIAGLHQFKPTLIYALRKAINTIDNKHPAAEWFETKQLDYRLSQFEQGLHSSNFQNLHYALLVARFLQWQESRI